MTIGISPERQALIARVAALRGTGMSTAAVGRRCGVSKNVVIGIIGRNLPHLQREPTRPYRTMAERLDALHARMDAALARLPCHYQPPPQKKGAGV